MKPLAERLRPAQLDQYVGQRHLLAEDSGLYQSIVNNRIHSMILWGPPGVGKTTLARIIAKESQRPFHSLSAINAGVKDVRDVIEKARKQHFFDQPGPIVFIDEIHRFNKAQQDSLLGAVEDGTIVLIGATTENPSFEVISALLSRCQVYILKSLALDDLKALAQRALTKDEYLKEKQLSLVDFDALAFHSMGDARRLLNLIEVISEALEPKAEITNELVESIAKVQLRRYDKGGDQHYDIASAMIKSIRGSDPDAALYWMARMLDGGEDVKFVARRLIISASEDIGLANPNALLLANAGFQSVNVIGMPEARIVLSEVIIYLATSPKSNTAYTAIDKALETVRSTGNINVPLHLRNSPTALMKSLNYGKGYKYPHDSKDNFIVQQYLPTELESMTFYFPGENSTESRIKAFLKEKWKK
jgi:putative ATPase